MKKQILPLALALALCASLTPPAQAAGFTDVPASEYYSQPVAWAVERSITGGTSETTFSPGASCTTAQILTFLWRAEGSPAPAAGTLPFVDAKREEYYYQASLWARERGLAEGSLLFPDTPCTRAQTVNYLWILAGRPAHGQRRVSAGEGETASGIPADVLSTAFFDVTVQGASLTGGGDPAAGDGKALLAVDITVRNTYEKALTMYDTDFQIQWGPGAGDFGYPIADKALQLPESYQLEAGEERTGRLLYEIPAGSRTITLAYRDFFTDGTTGGTFYCRFDLADGQAVPPALFEDVPASSELASAVLWAYQAGIASGAGSGFDPEGVCTRGQIVTFLYRAYGEKS